MKPTGDWFPIYVADYLADTMHLDTEEHGMYLLLLMAYWRRGGPLPDDPKFLARVCQLTPKRFQIRFPRVSVFFSLRDGQWTHDFMEKQILSYSFRHSRAKLAGSLGAAQRWRLEDKKIEEKEERKNILSEVGKKPPSARKAQVYDLAFEAFWKAYPDRRNNSKPAAFREWGKLAEEDQRLATESLAAFSDYCRRTPDYRVVHCERYLRDRRFENWAEPTPKQKWFSV